MLMHGFRSRRSPRSGTGTGGRFCAALDVPNSTAELSWWRATALLLSSGHPELSSDGSSPLSGRVARSAVRCIHSRHVLLLSHRPLAMSPGVQQPFFGCDRPPCGGRNGVAQRTRRAPGAGTTPAQQRPAGALRKGECQSLGRVRVAGPARDLARVVGHPRWGRLPHRRREEA
jgi:hypothetical protein